MKLVILWTDVLVWLLVVVVMGYVLYARRRDHLVAPWRKVGRSAAGMASLVVLAASALVALADSVHYRERLTQKDPAAPPTYAVEVLSLLDAALVHLRTRNERTYSAPFATHAYVKETTELPDGKVLRDYPRLRHGGAHLADPSADRAGDIARTAFVGFALGTVAWLAAIALVTAWTARGAHAGFGAQWHRIWAGRTAIEWRAVFVALGVMAVVVAPLLALSPKYHVFGTDKVGQDVFYLALKSLRTALVIGGLTTLITLPIGIFAGLAAGYFRGRVDDVIQYIYTTLNSIPSVLLIVASMLLLQVYLERYAEYFPTSVERADVRLLLLCVILGVTSWTGLARLLRGEALKVRELDYIQAARAFGVTHGRVLTRHMLPNVMHIVLISLVMEFSGLVLAEAVLSYIGVGVDPTMISFGTMINAARLEMAREPMVWWALAAAFGCMFLLVLAANLFADAVRDAFDPRTAVGTDARIAGVRG
jgi:peptide/nickel transport system permease protein